MRIDLHTHSVNSDGTDHPQELMVRAVAAGLDVVALTDHDTTSGWAGATAAVEELPMRLVRGAEITCSHRGVSVHLLAYLFDPASESLQTMMTRSRHSRDDRARTMVELLSRDMDVSWEDVRAVAEPGATIGRPHVADALVLRGIVPDRSAAFTELLHQDSPYYVPYWAPAAIEVIAAVVAAGGVPVLAHPLARARGEVLDLADFERLAESGLMGMEVDHREHTPAQRKLLTQWCTERGLLRTGSSDYHGAGKPNQLGENLTSEEVLNQIVACASQPVVGRG